MDTFECAHIASLKTIETQTYLGDIELNSKFIMPSNSNSKNITNWFVAPLLNNKSINQTPNNKSKLKTSKQSIITIPQKEDKQSSSINNEEKENDANTYTQTINKESKYVPIPIIGARTAGLSYIDPSIKINENSLKINRPSINKIEEENENKIEEEKESVSIQNKTNQNCIIFKQNKSSLNNMNPTKRINNNVLNNSNINDFQNDIAVMDAQLAHLSSICNNIQNNYYNIDKKLNNNQESYEFQENKIENNNDKSLKNNNNEQINTMKAWELLQGIQQNLNVIDDDINKLDGEYFTQNNTNNRKHKLQKIKAKSKKKKRKQLTAKLDKQTKLLTSIYDKLSK